MVYCERESHNARGLTAHEETPACEYPHEIAPPGNDWLATRTYAADDPANYAYR